jgi:hypothetical protein
MIQQNTSECVRDKEEQTGRRIIHPGTHPEPRPDEVWKTKSSRRCHYKALIEGKIISPLTK